MTGLRNFEDLIQECIDCDKNLLLGNGFSIAYEKDTFTYQSLINESSLPQKIKKLFEIFNTTDYELVINNLKVLAETFSNRNISTEIKNIVELVKRDLVRTILNKHPKSQFEVNITRKENTLSFLLNYNNIFTLNYDLLLYWIIMYYLDIQNGKVNYCDILANSNHTIDDGFESYRSFDCVWTNKRKKQNIYYMHGALYLFHDETNTYKIKYDKFRDTSLLKQIKDYIKSNTSPLVITEGNSDDKLKWIRGNHYLNYCYEQFCQIQGVLFIHGHSLDDKDKHIFDAINTNPNIKAVYISIFDPKTNEENIRRKAYERFSERLNNQSLVVDFYNAQSVALW